MSANGAGSGLLMAPAPLSGPVDSFRPSYQWDMGGLSGLPITGAGGAPTVPTLPTGPGGTPVNGGSGGEPGIPGAPTPGEIRRGTLGRSRDMQVLAQGAGGAVTQLAKGYRMARQRLLGGGA